MAAAKPKREAKIVVVGDGLVGKTCLLMSYVHKHFPVNYVPTVFDVYTEEMELGGVIYNTRLWDTAGQENYDKLRLLTYPKTKCFLLCFSLENRTSYVNVREKWIPELRHYCPDAPIILVGTKSDIRRPHNPSHITSCEGRRLKREIKASDYVECSAKNEDDLNEVFIAALNAIRRADEPKTACCTFM